MKNEKMVVTITKEFQVFDAEDIEQAVSAKLGRPVKISDLECQVIDFFDNKLGKKLEDVFFDETTLAETEIALGSTEFWILNPDDESGDFILDINEDWPDIKYPYHTPEKYIFNFDINMFKSYDRWDD